MKRTEKQKKKYARIVKTAGILLAATLLMQGCIRVDGKKQPSDSSDVTPVGTQKNYYYQTVNYNYKTDISGVLQDITTGMSADYLLLVNKEHPIIDRYDPQKNSYILENMVTLTDRVTKSGMELEARTARALYAMLAEMAADGITDVKITSAYRSEDYQTTLFNRYLNSEQSGISQDARAFFGDDYIQANYTSKGYRQLSPEDARLVANFYSAFPGQSEHHTGLCIDFVTSQVSLTNAFANTPAGKWLANNAYRFGFILRYPQEKESITGYCFEPWHFRFVGREAATEMWHSGLCLEEFLQQNQIAAP